MWTPAQVGTWLTLSGMPDISTKFVEEGVTGAAMLDMPLKGLKDFQIEQRVRFKKARAQLQTISKGI